MAKREEAQPRNRYAAIARDVIVEASRGYTQEGFAAALAEELQGQPYHRNTIGPWLEGDRVPPGDVVLAAAKLAGIDLGARTGTRSLTDRMDALEDRQGDLEARVQRFDAVRTRLEGLLDSDSAATPN